MPSFPPPPAHAGSSDSLSARLATFPQPPATSPPHNHSHSHIIVPSSHPPIPARRDSIQGNMPDALSPTSPNRSPGTITGIITKPPPFPPKPLAHSSSSASAASKRPTSRIIRTFDEVRVTTTITAEEWYEELECGVCSHVLGAPQALVPCGHSLCGPCAWEWIKKHHNLSCPHCRQDLHEALPFVPNISLDQVIERKLRALPDSPEKLDITTERLEKTESWKLLQAAIHATPAPKRPGGMFSSMFDSRQSRAEAREARDRDRERNHRLTSGAQATGALGGEYNPIRLEGEASDDAALTAAAAPRVPFNPTQPFRGGRTLAQIHLDEAASRSADPAAHAAERRAVIERVERADREQRADAMQRLIDHQVLRPAPVVDRSYGGAGSGGSSLTLDGPGGEDTAQGRSVRMAQILAENRAARRRQLSAGETARTDEEQVRSRHSAARSRIEPPRASGGPPPPSQPSPLQTTAATPHADGPPRTPRRSSLVQPGSPGPTIPPRAPRAETGPGSLRVRIDPTPPRMIRAQTATAASTTITTATPANERDERGITSPRSAMARSRAYSGSAMPHVISPRRESIGASILIASPTAGTAAPSAASLFGAARPSVGQTATQGSGAQRSTPSRSRTLEARQARGRRAESERALVQLSDDG